LKLKLEYAEKYNEDAKIREKETREEIARMRNANEVALKEARERAEQEMKVQVAVVEERRAKAVAESQQLEQKLLQYQKDNEKQTALLEQGIEFAKKSATESQQREAECRRALESLRKDFDNEVKTLQQKLELDKANLTKQVISCTESSKCCLSRLLLRRTVAGRDSHGRPGQGERCNKRMEREVRFPDFTIVQPTQAAAG
jgi:hypothetical protein